MMSSWCSSSDFKIWLTHGGIQQWVNRKGSIYFLIDHSCVLFTTWCQRVLRTAGYKRATKVKDGSYTSNQHKHQQWLRAPCCISSHRRHLGTKWQLNTWDLTAWGHTIYIIWSHIIIRSFCSTVIVITPLKEAGVGKCSWYSGLSVVSLLDWWLMVANDKVKRT